MPLSFYHGFEAAEPVTRAAYPEQVRKLLEFLDGLQARDDQCQGTQFVAMCIETKFIRAKDASSVAFRWTDDPKAPAVSVREEDFMRNLFTYKQLTDTVKRRYSDFLENAKYHRIRQELEKEKRHCIERLLNPSNPGSSKQRFYNPSIVREFDKHYKIRSKALVSADGSPPSK
jgi:hypothetical protein